MTKKTYKILTAHGCSFVEMVEELLSKVSERGLLRLVFFGSPTDNEQYIKQREIIKQAVCEKFKNSIPMISYVAQKPLFGELKMEVMSLDESHAQELIRYESDYLMIGDNELVTSGILADDINSPITEQSDQIFERIETILSKEGFEINDIVRQWNYIERITAMADGKQHYQDFNDSRSRFYSKCSWDEGYPAATGIGTQRGGIMVELDALKPTPGVRSVALDNPLQIAAHSYSKQVLIGQNEAPKTTPKFERARIVENGKWAQIYISGTAAIRGEESCLNDIVQQTRLTMENIDYLIGKENRVRAGVNINAVEKYALIRVYLKNVEDVEVVREYINKHYPDIPKFFLFADVCREELLIEIEGVATLNV